MDATREAGLFKYLGGRLLLLSKDQPGSMREHLWEWGVTGTNRPPLQPLLPGGWVFGSEGSSLPVLAAEGSKTILEKDPSHPDQRCVTPPSLLSPSWIIPRRPSQSKIGRCGSQRAEWAVTSKVLHCSHIRKPASESVARKISFELNDFRVQIC